MKIYTRTGDGGTTGLFGGGRVQKDEPRVEAYGAVDELSACIGVARAHVPAGAVAECLRQILADLLTLGAELGCLPGKEERLGLRLIDADDTRRLEAAIDSAEIGLAPLKSFILPGGAPGGAFLHQARTVCRRAERRVLASHRLTPVRAEVLAYINRLSDLLFVLARKVNHEAGHLEEVWTPRTP